MKRYQIIIAIISVLTIAACKKEGKLIAVHMKGSQPINIQGFAIGDTIEQYFDGRKIREFIGRGSFGGRIIFDSDAPVLMELKKKGDPATLFSKTIRRDSVEALKPITFFYDGSKMNERYNYPDAVAGVEQIALYFDLPDGMAIDIAFGDITGDVNALHYFKRNVQPKTWVGFESLKPIEAGDLYLFILKAGTQEYLILNNFERSYVPINIPTTQGSYQGGGVQSSYVSYQVDVQGNPGLATQDLIGMYPR